MASRRAINRSGKEARRGRREVCSPNTSGACRQLSLSLPLLSPATPVVDISERHARTGGGWRETDLDFGMISAVQQRPWTKRMRECQSPWRRNARHRV